MHDLSLKDKDHDEIVNALNEKLDEYEREKHERLKQHERYDLWFILHKIYKASRQSLCKALNNNILPHSVVASNEVFGLVGSALSRSSLLRLF